MWGIRDIGLGASLHVNIVFFYDGLYLAYIFSVDVPLNIDILLIILILI